MPDTSFFDSISQTIKSKANKDGNYFGDNAHMNAESGKAIDGVTESLDTASKIEANTNLSSGTKAKAQALNAVEGGLQAFQALSGLTQNAFDSVALPVLGALGMKGMASLPVTRQLDPVMGIDPHMVVIPPSPAPVPMPHPYVGVLIRPKDFVTATVASFVPPPPVPPQLSDTPTEAEQVAANKNKAANLAHMGGTMVLQNMGASVLFEGLPRAVAGTPTKSVPHFPMGASFHPATSMAIKKNKGHAFMGSLLALADNDPISGGGTHMHLSCADVGSPSPHTLRKSKNTDGDKKPFPAQLFLPTGMIMPIPPTKSILTNPIPAPFNPMTMATKAAKGAFKKLTKKPAGKMHDMVNNSKIKSEKLNDVLHKAICTVTGHPVDVASGMFFTDEEDFFLNGPIPLSWERTWYSKSDYKGPLGNGWHHNYDMGIVIDDQAVTLRMADGRPIAFKKPLLNAPEYNKAERLELRLNDKGEYYVWNVKEDLYYHFTTQAYNDVHLLRSVVNANSFSIQFTYNKKGYLEAIKDSAGRPLTITNDAKGRILKIAALHPKNITKKFIIAQYNYDDTGNMLQQTNAEGDSMYFEYEGYLMVKEIWRNGLTWHFRYDGTEIGSRCVHTWGDGNIYNHKLTFKEGLTLVENSLGNVTEYYHKGGLVYKQEDPNGAIHQWDYDENNQLLSETDPLGNATLYNYDDFGNQIEIIDPNGAKIETEYPKEELPHLPEQAKDANGGTWKWQYDTQGNTIARTNPMGAATKMHYENGLLQHITNTLGNTTQLEYNNQYQIKKVTDAQGNTTQYRYDTLGRCTQITNPKGAVQRREFDLLGRVIKIKDFDGNTIELAYDGIDNLIQYNDDHQEVKYAYRGMWKLAWRADQRGTTQYRYNTEEQLTKILNEKGEAYTFTLDSVGNVLQEQSFDDAIKKYERDLAGQVTKLTKNSGKTITYDYDNSGRITDITHDNGDTQTFDYNPAGQLITAINKDAEVSFTRNALGLITNEAVNGQSITHQYNNLGVRTALKSSLGANIQFQHDNFGNLANLTADNSDTQWEANYKYDSLGFDLERILPGKLQQEFNYDNIGRLTQQSTLQSKKQKHKRRYTWGVNDRLLKTEDSKQGTNRYTYSPTGHLELATFGNGEEQLRLPDKVGNLYESNSLNDREYSKGGRLDKKGSWIYKYDDDGFLIEKYKSSGGFLARKKDGWKYQWNAEGMLEKVTRPDKLVVSFTYDALGRRLSKTFKNTVTKWLWDGNVPLHEWKEHAITGDILSNSTVGDDGVITWVFEEHSFIPTAKLKGNKKYSILADHLGTPTQMYNEEGEAVWERSLDTFGRVQHGNHSSCPFMYQGQYYDDEIELAYNRYRYYSSDTGTYISIDPIGLLSGENNFYSYVDDPNLEIDGSGLAKSAAYKNAWNKARRDFWKKEAKNASTASPRKYSDTNIERMKKGLAPQMKVEVWSYKRQQFEIKNVSMELEHTHLKQRGGSLKAHEEWNLTKTTPWGHEAMDPYRHTGYSLERVIEGTGSF